MNLGQAVEDRPSGFVRARKPSVSKAVMDDAILLNLQEIVRRLRKEYITRAIGNDWRRMIYAEIRKKNGITWKKLGTDRRELKQLIKNALLYKS